MKSFLIGLGIILLYIIFLPYEQDNNTYIRQLENLKYVADECSASASLYLDNSIKNGDIIYNKTQGKMAIENTLKNNLKLDDNLYPMKGSYWNDTIKYDVYYIDDTYTFPYEFKDKRTSYIKLITEPTVIVTIDAGRPTFRLKFLKPQNAIRSSGYEYVGR